jgi:hypothetical protein
MSQIASIRAGQVKSNIEAAAVVGGDGGARFRAAIAPGTLRAVDDASRISWLPITTDVEIYKVGLELFGAADNRRRVRRALTATIESPLIRPILDGAVRLFGVTPAALFKFMPPAWSAVYRACGTLAVEPAGPDRVVITSTGTAAEMLDDVYAQGVANALGAVLELCHVEGEVALTGLDRDRRSVTYTATWTPRA